MIINPSSYSFTPPVNMAPVTGYVTSVWRVDDSTLVSAWPLPASATGDSFAAIKTHSLANGYAGVELKLSVRSTGYGAESVNVYGVDTFSFQPAPDPPSNIVIVA